jgi:murein DD-endopeptidase MepM/ murein hydrolase activator NlpD
MTDFIETVNAGKHGMFRKFLKPRDIFLHDGSKLRRIRVGIGTQVSAAFASVMMIGWSAFAAAQFAAPASVNPEVVRMQQQVQAMQADVESIKQQVQTRYQITQREIRELGLDPKRFQGQGGPFEAVQPLQSADPQFKALFTSWKQLDQLERGTIAIPSMKPVSNANFTSGFGVRSDPFRGRSAMHAGIDLAGPTGTPIYATADGRVGRSGWVGAYGNLIELEHGRGIQTRYGHLSRSIVAAGERVQRGQLIGYMGSTGRSTGPHLHYEVRIDGKAVNPIPFMQGNDYLASVQRRAASQVAQGGPVEGTR